MNAAATTRPTGTVTFLFTDIEGSTRMLRALNDEYRAVQDRHAAIVRGAITAQHGHEIRTEGDSFFAVFRSPVAAVTAAVEAQRGLAEAEWPAGNQLRVRMGLHTGEGIPGGDDYVGIDVNRAARISSAAHGGQVLLSDATRALVATRLPEGVRVRTVGSYRLNDIPEPELLHQLEIHGVRSGFPPLRALDVRRAHLPLEETTFIGRANAVEALAALIPERRLVTLTGTGGVGKTRLALRTAAEAAGHFPDGAYFVALASIREAALVPAAIASELNLSDCGTSTLDTCGEAALACNTPSTCDDTLRDWLQDREVLLVLDNVEQIRGAGPAVGALLRAAPGLHVLATSRSPLHVSGEQEFPVEPLPVPSRDETPGELATTDSVRLFTDRVRLINPAFGPDPGDLAVIADVCRRLDGLPLAIELAAARTRLLSLTGVRDRLAHRLDVLTGGPSTAPRRQHSLRETIEWSHDLLNDGDKALLRRLAVFVGGWTIDAASTVCTGPPVGDVERGLEALTEHSLVQRSRVGTGEPRFMLLEAVHEFAAEQLDTFGEANDAATTHATFFRELAGDALRHSDGLDRAAWFDRLDAELDNLRAAIERSAARGDDRQGLAIAAALRPFWLQRNHSAEGLRILAALVEQAAPRGAEFAAGAAAAAAIACWLGDDATARRMAQLSAKAYGDIGDRRGQADALVSLSSATTKLDPVTALQLNDRCLKTLREFGDIRGEGQALLARATAQLALRQLPESRHSLERAQELLRRADDEYCELFATLLLGRVQLLTGDAPAGMVTYRTALQKSRERNLWIGFAAALDLVAEVAIWANDPARAVRLGAAAQRLKDELGGGIPPASGGALPALVAAKEQLTDAEFDRHADAGATMDLDSVIADALAIEPTARIITPVRPLSSAR